jgi:hypothetical protein
MWTFIEGFIKFIKLCLLELTLTKDCSIPDSVRGSRSVAEADGNVVHGQVDVTAVHVTLVFLQRLPGRLLGREVGGSVAGWTALVI